MTLAEPRFVQGRRDFLDEIAPGTFRITEWLEHGIAAALARPVTFA
jgi:hypothetical protein